MVTLYTTPTCGYCHAARRLLQARGLEFTEIDVSRQPELRARLSRENGHYRTVPMIFIGDRFIGGYDQLARLDVAGLLLPQVRLAKGAP